MTIYRIFLLVLLALSTHLAVAQEADANAAEEPTEAGDAVAEESVEKNAGPPPPIYLAAKRGQLDKLRRLIEEGADVEAVNKQGRTPLMAAIKSRNSKVVRELIFEGINVNTVDQQGQTALLMAIQWGEADIVRLLLEEGADVSLADKQNRSPLTMAEKIKDKELKELIESASAGESQG